MQGTELSFVIPTHRLRDVGETVEHYDEHFWRNGHSVRIIVFDDSTPVNQQKYYPLLEQTRTHQEVHYVGPREKEQFLGYLNGRLRDKRLEALVKNLFRPSYGGNRNFSLMYTLGGLMVTHFERRSMPVFWNRHSGPGRPGWPDFIGARIVFGLGNSFGGRL